MKKICKYLLLVILIMPLFVKADVAPPLLNERKVKIVNKNGTDIVNGLGEKIGTVKYKEVVSIESEMLINNELYGEIEYLTGKYIKLSDTVLVDKNVKKENFKKDYTRKFYVFDDTNILYKGPSKTYGKVEPETKLKVGTTIESEYFDSMWMYVEQDGVSGWVYIYTNDNFSLYEPAGLVEILEGNITEYKTTSKVVLYDNPKNGKEIGVTVPAKTKLKVEYVYVTGTSEESYYVTYKDKKGWTSTKAYDIKDETNYDVQISEENKNIVFKILVGLLGIVIISSSTFITSKMLNKKGK